MSEILTDIFKEEEPAGGVSLAAMLRAHQTEEELIHRTAPILVAELMKQSDLTREGVPAEMPSPVLSEPAREKLTAIPGADDAFAGEVQNVQELLRGRRQTVICGSLTAEQILLSGDEVSVHFPEGTGSGPFGYDVASLIVSGLLAWCHGQAMIRDEYEKDDFCDYCLDIVADLADQLVWNYDCLYEELATAEQAADEGYKASYIRSMMTDLAAAAGLEALRVLTGDRVSAEKEEIIASGYAAETEAVLLDFAKKCILEKETFFCGADFAAAIESTLRDLEA